jgi:uridine kinase
MIRNAFDQINSHSVATFIILSIKIFLALFFTSDYARLLFLPFLAQALDHPTDPWASALNHAPTGGYPLSPFPYPPVMYGIYLPIASLVKILAPSPVLLTNLVFKLPTFAADIGIFLMLRRIFPKKPGTVLLVYFASPIILYSCYMHSQLDLIPTGLLMASIYLLTRNHLAYSAVLLAMAVCAKFHVFAALPLILVYIFKNFRRIYTFYYLTIFAVICSIVLAPYAGSAGFRHFVLENEQQRKLLDSFYQIGDLKIYLPLFAVFILYLRFYIYRKINTDLLFSYLTTLFLTFIMLISPAPGWFVWIVPFVSVVFVRIGKEDHVALLLYFAVAVACVIFSLFFFRSEIADLRFIHWPINVKIENPLWRNYGFTGIEALFFCLLVYVYRHGVKSNAIYKMDQAIVIGIAGDSSTGKSTLLSDIRKLISSERLVLLEGDGDHKWERGSREWQELTHLNPKANFLHRQAEQIIALKNHRHIDRTDYDHSTGKFTAPQRILSNDIIVLAGLHAFYLPISRKAIDLKIYLGVAENLRRHWKICRDTTQRNHDIAHTLQQIESRMEDARKYIHPQRQFADIVLEYFTESHFKIGDPEAKPKVQLKIWMNANINIEPILRFLDERRVDYTHDFEEDLKNQYLMLPEEVDFSALLRGADELVVNLDELVGKDVIWENGFRGLVQLVVALNLSMLFSDRKANYVA